MNKYQEALDGLLENIDYKDYSIQTINKVAEAIVILQELVDKATPKKVNLYSFEHNKGKCPVCNNTVYSFMNTYCQICGQKLDWSGEDERT